MQSSKVGTSFCDSADDFVIGVSHLGESVAKICKFVSCLEVLTFHHAGWKARRRLTRFWLVGA